MQPSADTVEGLRAAAERYLAQDPARVVLKLPMTASSSEGLVVTPWMGSASQAPATSSSMALST
jgi:hypothetical protein